MSKIKTLKIAVFVLLFINLVMLTFHFTRGGGGNSRPGNIQEIIINDLGFDDQQALAYDDLIDIHQKNIRRLEKEKADIKRKLYNLLDGKEDHDKGQPELIARLGSIQVEIEATHYEHFNRIRQLCEGDQIAKFDVFKKKLDNIFTPKPPQGGR